MQISINHKYTAYVPDNYTAQQIRAFKIGVAFALGKAYALQQQTANDYNPNHGKNGQFAKSNSHATKTTKSRKAQKREHFFKTAKQFYGKVEFKGYKNTQAVNKLLKEQQGYIKGAFYSKALNCHVDLVWGDLKAGVAHIIDRHGEDALRKIPDIVNNGVIIEELSNDSNHVLYKDNAVAVVSKGFKDDSSAKLVVTSYVPTQEWAIKEIQKSLNKKKAS